MKVIRSSFVCEALVRGLLVHWQPGWKPTLTLATDPARPWFPVVFGMYGDGSSTTRMTAYARKVTSDKPLSETLLREAGFRVPDGRTFAPGDADAARAYALSLDDSVVVKPAEGGKGRGVTVGVVDDSDFTAAISYLAEEGYGYRPFLVQRRVMGTVYRITALRRSVISVLQHIPASVIGDGTSTIRELFKERELSRIARWTNATPFRIERQTERLLQRNGLSFDSVPDKDVDVPLSLVGNRNRGSDVVEVWGETDPSVLEYATSIVRAIPGADVLGIDLVLSSGHRTLLENQTATVIEVNAGAALGGMMSPTSGLPRNPYRMIFEDLAVDAGLQLTNEPEESTIALRPKYSKLSVEEIVEQLQDVDGVSVSVGPITGEDIICASGPTGDLNVLLDRLAALTGSVTGISVTAFSNQSNDWFDQVLHPSSITPNDHMAVLAASQARPHR